MARTGAAWVDAALARLAGELGAANAAEVAEAGLGGEADAPVGAGLTCAEVDARLAVGVGEAAGAGAHVAVGQVGAGGAVEARVAGALVDVGGAGGAGVAGQACAEEAVDGLAADAFAGGAWIRLTQVDQSLAVGAWLIMVLIISD